jgi:hypothetical protein
MIAGGVLVFLVVIGAGAASPGLLRVGAALSIAAIFMAACLKCPRRVVVALVVWLAVFGTLRRVLLPADVSADADPLLLVAPAIAGVLAMVAVGSGAFSRPTSLAKAVTAFAALVLIAALNPLQGGLSVGAGGLLFVFVPLLWFWIGRALIDDSLLARVFRLVSLLSLVAAVYGLLQVYSGFPAWDQRWIDTKGYAALHIGESVRPFATFSSSSEYVSFLAIGMLLWACRLGKRASVIPSVAALGVLGWALAVASVRGALVVVPIALGITYATSKGFGMGRTMLAGISALFILGLVVSRIDPGVGGGQSSVLVSRQVTGLSDPFNRETSTLPLHVDALVTGLQDGFRNPVGRGLGVITLAGQKFGTGGEQVSTDVDPSNVAVAMGLPGLLLYSAIVFGAMGLCFRVARQERSYLALAVLGVALVTLLQWLNGGNYAVAPLVWMSLGWLDRHALGGTARSPAPARDSDAVLVG